ncbi:tetratricopeptide repeat protein, partial [Anaerolineales bacterium HSG24]|nr:tetratricopeptide repeat protein [Anaerolineales bacterium HSG24]
PEGARIATLCSANDLSMPIPFYTYGYRDVGYREGVPAEGRLLGQAMKTESYSLLLDTTQIGPGMSGSPLYIPQVDRVVGVVTAVWTKRTEIGVDHNTSFAMPAEEIQRLWPELVFEPPQPDRPDIPQDKPPRPKPFIDRKAELKKLLAQLHPGQTVTLCGPGGMGKTALASEAIWQLATDRFPDGIIFHSFYDFPQTDIALEYIITSLGGQAEPPLDLTAKRLLAGKRLLLLLDGAEDADDLKRLQKLTGSCGIIITSRKRSDAPNPRQRQDITPLPADEALTLLKTLIYPQAQSLRVDDDRELIQIRDILGGWPLAVRLVGRYLAETGEPLADYLDWLKETPLAALSHGDHRQESVTVLLERTIDRLSEGAKELLSLTCLLAIAPFKRDWLTSALDKSFNQLRPAFNELTGYGLLQSLKVSETFRDSAPQYQLSHALIHTYIRHEVTPLGSEQLKLSTELIEQLEKTLLTEANQINNAGYPLAMTWSNHLRVITDLAIAQSHQPAAGLANELGYYLNSIANYEAARPYFEKALEINREVLGQRHPDTAQSLNNLGALLRAMGDYEAARPYYEKALEIRREVLGQRHPSTAQSLNNLGFLLQAMGDYEAARPYYEKALEINREVLGQRHPLTASSLNNLGGLLDSMGDYEAARPYYEKALEIHREVLGQRHPDTATSLRCWASGTRPRRLA